MQKIEKDRPGIISFPILDKKDALIDYKEIYIHLTRNLRIQFPIYSIKYTKNPLHILTVIEGFVSYKNSSGEDVEHGFEDLRTTLINGKEFIRYESFYYC